MLVALVHAFDAWSRPGDRSGTTCRRRSDCKNIGLWRRAGLRLPPPRWALARQRAFARHATSGTIACGDLLVSTGDSESAISLPQGGGAVRGIGETFEPNPFTGTGSFAVPIATSPARRGFGPALSLQYSSGSGSAAFGLGWSLSVPKVSRRTERGLPRYDAHDSFAISGADELVPADGDATTRDGCLVTRYRSRTEAYARIERWEDASTGDMHWRGTTTAGVTNIYGRSAAARLTDPADPRRVSEWLLEETHDEYGNEILYEYARDAPALYGDDPARRLPELYEANRVATQVYVRRICYGGIPDPLVDDNGVPIAYAGGGAVGVLRGNRRFAFEVVLDYGDRTLTEYIPPPADGEQELFGLDVPVRDDRVSSFRAGFEVRTLRLCRRVLMFHHFAELGGPTLVRSTDLAYRLDPETQMSLLASAAVTGYRRTTDGTYHAATIPATTFQYSELRIEHRRYRALRAIGDDGPAATLDQPGIALVDLFGDGLPDVVQSTPVGLRYWRNLGDGVLDRPRSLAQVPADVRLDRPGIAFGDTAGDGHVDLIVTSGPLAGFYETTTDGAWATFRRFEHMPSFDVDDANVRLVDLTGDGRSDALQTTAAGLLWFPSLGERGYGPPQRVARLHDLDRFPDLAFDDPGRRVRLADMTGDGLNDIVFVHDGRIEYWPNLGYGRFGPRVTMANAPRFGRDFDPARLLLADVDGTGCADLLYVDFDRVHVWFNRSGNAWSLPTTVTGTPRTTDPSAVRAADMFGTGTTSLVWSFPFRGQPNGNYKVLDLCGGVKPLVLVEMSSGLGSTTRVRYGASTAHFLADRAERTPWQTQLPFPVQVVDEVEAIDHITGTRRLTRFRYHHGCFDGREREFRGFARVDRFDAETFEAIAHQLPPVETRTWFHPGVRFDAATLAGERYAGDLRALPLTDHALDTNDSVSDADRAMRGAILRTEVYARDRTARDPHAYLVNEARYQVTCLQPRRGRAGGVYARTQLENITYNYEREPSDPRISHVLTLEIDGFGNALRTLSIAYPRRIADAALPTDADRALQRTAHVVYQQARFTNAIDDGDHYRLPIVCEQQRFELVAPPPPADGERYRIDEWTASGFAAVDGPRRLIDHTRSYFRADDLASRLPLGSVEPLALGAMQLRLAFTPELVTDTYGDRVDDAMLVAAGYEHEDGGWWVSSGRTFFSRDPADPPAVELAEARRVAFTPQRYRDAFGNDTQVRLDAYALLTVESVDALGNVSAAECDYRVLQPFRVTDANGNRRQVAFDTTGLVVASAVMGKQGSGEGDDLTGFDSDLTRAELDALFAAPEVHAPSLLGGATQRIVRDFERFGLTGEPPYTMTIARETHGASPGAVQIAFAYVDGFGRELQHKTLVEAGRWIGSAAVVLDNKGHPVRTFEPFEDTTHVPRPANQVGAATTFIYDPRGRVIATVRADHAWTKIVFSPWRCETWDANDTALLDPATDPDVGAQLARWSTAEYLPTWHAQRDSGTLGADATDAAHKTAVHAGTPVITHTDSLGRPVLTIVHDRFERGGILVDELLATRQELDVRGAVRAVIDPAGRTTVRFTTDILGRRLRAATLDAADRWTLPDVSGNTVYAWDSRGHRLRTEYDALARATTSYLSINGSDELAITRTYYGEVAANAEVKNLRGRVTRVEDQAGVATIEAYDFAGAPLARTRQLATAYRDVLDWQTGPALEPEVYTRTSEYDAMGREVAMTAPDGTRMRFEYDRANRRTTIGATLPGATTETTFVSSIQYNASGQRIHIAYGNGVVTDNTYDATSRRLAQATTIRISNGGRLQDAQLTYDARGNLTRVHDGATPAIYFANSVVTADTDYTYSAAYRLVRALGREHAGQQLPTSWDDRSRVGLAQPGDGQSMQRYDESYAYDAAGNLTAVVHAAGGTGWTRAYAYAGATNQLEHTNVGATTETYTYDAAGNIIALANAGLEWNHLDQLQRADLGGGGIAYNVYDSGGRRARKVVEKNGGALIEERIDLDGFEVFRRRTASGAPRLVRETLHVMDGTTRIALVETATVVDSAPQARAPVIRYQLTGIAGAVALELDTAGAVISYEEYYPYGGTSYQAVRAEVAEPKRYRFAAKERDEETGLVYFGARYYAPWLGRWLSPDPDSLSGDPRSPYAYCGGDPINRSDPNGRTDYRNSQGEYVGSDGVADGGITIVTDKRDLNTIADRYQGSWIHRAGGALLAIGIGLLVGGLIGLLLFGLSSGAGVVAALGGLAGGLIGAQWSKTQRMFWAKTSTNVNDLNGDHFDVSRDMRKAGTEAVDRSNKPTAPDDRKTIDLGADGNPIAVDFAPDTHKQGGFHEEGFVWGNKPGGPITIFNSKPGTASDPSTHGDAAINPLDTNPPLPDTFRVLGTLHVHPAGKSGDIPLEDPDKPTLTAPGVMRVENKQGGSFAVFGEKTWPYDQPPSDLDLMNAANEKPAHHFDIVIGARDGWVYFYNDGGQQARMRYEDFKK